MNRHFEKSSENSQHVLACREQDNKEDWSKLGSKSGSQIDIDKLYSCIWSEKKPSASASLTPLERMQYERQSSAGLAQYVHCPNVKPALDHPNQSRFPDGRISKLPLDVVERPNEFKHPQESKRELPPIVIIDDPALLDDRNSKERSVRSDSLHNGSSRGSGTVEKAVGIVENDSPKGTGSDPVEKSVGIVAKDSFVNVPAATNKNELPGNGTVERPAPRLDNLDNPSVVDNHHKRHSSITQKVSYPDGSARVVERDERGKINLVINPDGSRLERIEGKDGEKASWRAVSRYGTELASKSFRGEVQMREDGTFRMLQTYPVKQLYEQKTDGSYRQAYAGGAKIQLNAEDSTETILYPNGKARTIKYTANEKGILEATEVKDR